MLQFTRTFTKSKSIHINFLTNSPKLLKVHLHRFYSNLWTNLPNSKHLVINYYDEHLLIDIDTYLIQSCDLKDVGVFYPIIIFSRLNFLQFLSISVGHIIWLFQQFLRSQSLIFESNYLKIKFSFSHLDVSSVDQFRF
jgi:hypothetical protein